MPSKKSNAEWVKEYYHSNPDYRAASILRASQWNSKNKEKRKQIVSKSRSRNSSFSDTKEKARRRGLEWSLTKEQYLELRNKPCYYCNLPVLTARGGLDRIDNSKGYTISNVLPCCIICNQTRNIHYSVEETKLMITALLNFRKGAA